MAKDPATLCKTLATPSLTHPHDAYARVKKRQVRGSQTRSLFFSVMVFSFIADSGVFSRSHYI